MESIEIIQKRVSSKLSDVGLRSLLESSLQGKIVWGLPSGLESVGSNSEDLIHSDILCLCETWHTSKLNLQLPMKHDVYNSSSVITLRIEPTCGLLLAFNNSLFKETEHINVWEECIFNKNSNGWSTKIIRINNLNTKKI